MRNKAAISRRIIIAGASIKKHSSTVIVSLLRGMIFLEIMEESAGNSHSNGKEPLEQPKLASQSNETVQKEVKTALFVNYAAIAWHESRRKWVGDQSQRLRKMEKDPVISWSTSYEDLLLTHEPFAESIPLTEMVDFLVDIWHDEGLFD